ncbi:MAG: hypothetical protein ACH6QQ_00935 [Candidatus Carsonella ruddii]
MKIFQIRRKTLESDIEIKLNFFGNGIYKIKTYIFYFDYIISKLINYSSFDCYLRCYSDLKIDIYHCFKNVSITLGKILKKKKIYRYNSYFTCMDNIFILISIDICDKIYYYDNFIFLDLDIKIIREFFYCFSKNYNCCLYIYCFNYYNKNYIIESLFKLLGIIFYIAKTLKNKILTKKIF